MKTYITFGQSHEHVIEGKIFDKDCVAVIDARKLLCLMETDLFCSVF